MVKEPVSISSLGLSSDEGMMLAYLGSPRTIVQLAAKFDVSYSFSNQKLDIWVAKGYLKRVKTRGGKSIYQLNTTKVVNK